MPFVYSQDAIRNLERGIASDRFSTYLSVAKGDRHEAILLYQRNTVLSQALYGVLQPLEITFRNSIHRVMNIRTARSNWYEYAPLRFRELESVNKAIADIKKWSNAVTAGRVVSELTFGFWTRLISREYEKQLWVPHLHKAFPHLRKPDRATVSARFEAIKSLRNKIAHHECVVTRNLSQDYFNVVEALGWICPTTACWIQATTSFHRDYGR